MILQTLNQYYDRLKHDQNVMIPLPGYSLQKISFCLVIDQLGKMLQVHDLREPNGRKILPLQLIVPAEPQAVKRTSGIDSNFLWDNTGYVLGADNKEKPERALEKFTAFKDLHCRIGHGLGDEGMQALLRFLDGWDPVNAFELEYWKEMAGTNVVFQLEGEHMFLHDHPVIQQAWLKHLQGTQTEEALCLVNGVYGPVARLHPAIKGVRDAQSSGAALVSFNLKAFESYDKIQNFNAPVNEGVAFAYTTTLNHLLAPYSRQKVQIGDASTVFWTEKSSPLENFMADLFDGNWQVNNNRAEDSSTTKDIRDFLEAARQGLRLPSIDENVKFYILGLSPNMSRLSVRFWYISTVGQIKEKIGQHFRDMAIVRGFNTDPEFPGMWQLLRQTAVQGKMENIPPVLVGPFMRAVLTGCAYPSSLLGAVIGRIRAEQAMKSPKGNSVPNVNYFRAAIIKAYLNRMYRINNKQMEEVTMALNKENTNSGYCLGRLFAVLERIQERANPGINATIRDRYYGAASATPCRVFPVLLNLKNHHIAKMENKGEAVNQEKRIGEIMTQVQEFPAHLNLEGQAQFAIGYYHQRQAFFSKSDE